MLVRVKKLNENAVIPKYATPGSAAMDLTAVSEKRVVDGSVTYLEYSTGLAIEIPPGHVGLLFPRSSISSNTTLMLNNSVGVLDSDFRGEVTFRFKTLAAGATKKYNVGDRIGQILILPIPSIEFEAVTELTPTQRGEGGYGSSGR
jgi:dUTP diphosphatase